MVAEAKQQVLNEVINEVLLQLLNVNVSGLPQAGQPKGSDRDIQDIRRAFNL